jgi:hypothetical protein
MFFLIVGSWIGSALLASLIGESRNAAGTCLLLGLHFGPLGVIACLAIDHRLQCPHCGGRLNGKPEICQHCRSNLNWRRMPIPPESADAGKPGSESPPRRRRLASFLLRKLPRQHATKKAKMINYYCEKCGREFSAPSYAVGATMECPCGNPLFIPPSPTVRRNSGKIRFTCPRCGSTVKAPPERAGRMGKCPCGYRMRIPGERVVPASQAPKPPTEPKPEKEPPPPKPITPTELIKALSELDPQWAVPDRGKLEKHQPPSIGQAPTPVSEKSSSAAFRPPGGQDSSWGAAANPRCEPDDSWLCPECNFFNPQDLLRCRVCLQKRPKQPSIEPKAQPAVSM